jgi:predicted AAA+ superfamily ATPase
VSTTALEPSTKERELKPLLEITDSYPKYLLTLDSLAGGFTQGIEHVNIQDFLLDTGWSR